MSTSPTERVHVHPVAEAAHGATGPGARGDLVTACNGDCDDARQSVYPGSLEVCNGRDDDCDGLIDEALGEEDSDANGVANICEIEGYRRQPTPNVDKGYVVDWVIVRFSESLLRNADGVTFRPRDSEEAEDLRELGVSRIELASMLLYHATPSDNPVNRERLRTYRLFLAHGVEPAAVLYSLRSRSTVEAARFDWLIDPAGVVTPSDPAWEDNQYRHFGLENESEESDGMGLETNDTDIDAPQAWAITTGSARVKLAILDRGLSELALTRPSSIVDFANERIMPGYNVFAENEEEPRPIDDDGHGTWVTSIAAAKGNNGAYIAGVCWKCAIVPVRTQRNGPETISDITDAIYWAVDAEDDFHSQYDVDIINMSFRTRSGGCDKCEPPFLSGQDTTCAALRIAVNAADSDGVILVAASHNQNTNVQYLPGGLEAPGVTTPANCNKVVAVGATADDDSRWVDGSLGSNYGPELDIVAPGEEMSAIRLDGEEEPPLMKSGTSYAAPVVSGAMGLVRSRNPSLGSYGVVKAVLYSAQDFVGPAGEDTLGRDDEYGYGRVNLHDALRWVETDLSLRFTTKVDLSLEHDIGFKSGVTYDLLRGDLTDVATTNASTCEGRATSPSWSATETPSSGGQGYYYLSRINLSNAVYENFLGEWGGALSPSGTSEDRFPVFPAEQEFADCEGSGTFPGEN